jgi:hypothetical protein
MFKYFYAEDFEVLSAVNMSMLFFWVVTLCGLVGRYQRFGGTYVYFLGLKMKAVCSSEILVFTYKSTQRYNPENQHQYVYTISARSFIFITFYSRAEACENSR